jgi:protein-S-isoprenylcysteine O-methyltransferase Ste14
MAASSYLILESISQSAGLPLGLSFASTEPDAILTSFATTVNSLRTLLPGSLPAFHAFALFFYGTRLNLFLLYRELCLPRFRAMRERIEDRAKKQGSRLKRTPFLLSCTFLYFCMVCPVLVTTKVCEGMSMTGAVGLGGGLASFLEYSLRLSMIFTLSGYLLGAVGDLNKTIGKMLKGEDTLITGGIFRFFRHPNYTGEVIGWTSSCLAAFLAVALKAVTNANGNRGLQLWRSMAGLLSFSVMGAVGISFVLGTATAGLEFRQHEKYGDTDEYKQWMKKSWVGFKLGKQKNDEGGNGTQEKEE